MSDTLNLTDAVETYRRAARLYRGILYRWATGASGGRNIAATVRTRTRHGQVMDAVAGRLIAVGLDELRQALNEEHLLTMRISESRRNDIGRPELQARLRRERAYIADVLRPRARAAA